MQRIRDVLVFVRNLAIAVLALGLLYGLLLGVVWLMDLEGDTATCQEYEYPYCDEYEYPWPVSNRYGP